MNSGKYVFAQLLQYVNKYEFEKCVKRYKGNHKVRELDCWKRSVFKFNEPCSFQTKTLLTLIPPDSSTTSMSNAFIMRMIVLNFIS